MEPIGPAASRASGPGQSGPDKRPVLSRFKQQQLPAWQPILTPLPVILTFVIIGLIFLPVGVALLIASNNVTEVVYRYDKVCVATPVPTPCNITLKIPRKMSKPIYVYYRLDNFYQNHRRYARSRNDDQLNGKAVKKYSGLAPCDPVKSLNGSRDPANFFVPCGLIAASTFNDTFTFGGGSIAVNPSGIAWQSDVKKKFKNVPADSPGIRILNPSLFPNGQTDERFIVWMRIAGLPSFRKLWGKIDQTDIAKGDLSVVVQSSFPVASFDGKKYLVLSTTSWAGGKNNFLGVAYIVVGCLALAIAAILFVLHKLKPRRLGDPNYLRWK